MELQVRHLLVASLQMYYARISKCQNMFGTAALYGNLFKRCIRRCKRSLDPIAFVKMMFCQVMRNVPNSKPVLGIELICSLRQPEMGSRHRLI